MRYPNTVTTGACHYLAALFNLGNRAVSEFGIVLRGDVGETALRGRSVSPGNACEIICLKSASGQQQTQRLSFYRSTSYWEHFDVV